MGIFGEPMITMKIHKSVKIENESDFDDFAWSDKQGR